MAAGEGRPAAVVVNTPFVSALEHLPGAVGSAMPVGFATE
jgi:hypothetical protein